MRSLLTAIIIIVSTVSLPTTARAELCGIDPVPAATLLMPYFAVDTSKCNQSDGENTFLFVTNAQPQAALAHVTVWTDWSVPTYSFDMFLTGFDVQEINLKSLICSGKITATDNQLVNANTLAQYRAWHTGRPAPLSANCAGSPRGDDLAVGYVTIDNVLEEIGATLNPSSGASYFQKTSTDNFFVGQIYHLGYQTVTELAVETTPLETPKLQPCKNKKSEKQKIACRARNKAIKQLAPLIKAQTTLKTSEVQKSLGLRGYPAISIEADPSFNSSSSPSGLTFYGRYVAGGADHREPLPSKFVVQYGQSTELTDLDLAVWREGTANASPVACGLQPSGYPLATNEVFAFDEFENAVQLAPTIGIEAQLIQNFSQQSPFERGWFQMDLNRNGSRKQGWIVQRRDGVFDGAGVAHEDPCAAP